MENTLFYDPKSGRYFMCDSKTIEEAENKINEKLKSQNVYLNDFYDEINLEKTYPGTLLGWLKGSKINIEECVVTKYGTNEEEVRIINFNVDVPLKDLEEKWPYLSDEERMHIFKKYIGLEV